MTNETICAISTAPGVGGIAVIRISGSFNPGKQENRSHCNRPIHSPTEPL